MARLDRLAPVKEIGQIGAAIGREFSYSLMRALVGRDETALKDALAQLEQAGLVFRHWQTDGQGDLSDVTQNRVLLEFKYRR